MSAAVRPAFLCRFLHGVDGPEAVGVLVGDAVGVGGGAVADNLREDLRAAGLGVVEGFEDDHPGSLAEDEPAALGVERPAGGAGVGVGGGEGGQAVEPGDAERMNHRMRPAADHHIGIAAAKDLRGFPDRLRAGGTGGEAIQRAGRGRPLSRARCESGMFGSCSTSRVTFINSIASSPQRTESIAPLPPSPASTPRGRWW